MVAQVATEDLRVLTVVHQSCAGVYQPVARVVANSEKQKRASANGWPKRKAGNMPALLCSSRRLRRAEFRRKSARLFSPGAADARACANADPVAITQTSQVPGQPNGWHELRGLLTSDYLK